MLDFKNLTRKTVPDKTLHLILLIGKNPKYNGYQRGLASIVFTFFDTKTSGGAFKNENRSKKGVAEELYKAIITKINNRKAHSPLCVIDTHYVLLSKYAWVIPFEDKKGITITNAFQKLLHKSNRKPNKIWVGQ